MIVRLSSTALAFALVLGASAAALAQTPTPTPAPGGEADKPAPAPTTTPSTTTTPAPSDADKGKAAEKPDYAQATFGGGCFWCLEAVFERLPGVKSVVSGYAGGVVPRPSYQMVCTGQTGHAEVVQITYDPDLITYDDLLLTFFKCHDPTTLNRQGPDYGTQYRSIILYQNEDQKAAAQAMYRKLTDARAFASPIVTELVPLAAFYPAEAYHQNYYRKHPNASYCRINIAPKLKKLHLDNLNKKK